MAARDRSQRLPLPLGVGQPAQPPGVAVRSRRARPGQRRAGSQPRGADRARGRPPATAGPAAPRGPVARLARPLIRRGCRSARRQPRRRRDPHLSRSTDLAALLREEPQETRPRLRSLGHLVPSAGAKAAFSGSAAATKVVAAAATAVALSGAGAAVVTSGKDAVPCPCPTRPRRRLRPPAPSQPNRGARCITRAFPSLPRKRWRRRARLSPPAPPRGRLRSRRQPWTLRSPTRRSRRPRPAEALRLPGRQRRPPSLTASRTRFRHGPHRWLQRPRRRCCCRP